MSSPSSDVQRVGAPSLDELEDDLEWEEWNPKKLSFAHHMVAGSLAGLAEHISIFPIDTVKTFIQCEKCGTRTTFKTWSCVARMIQVEGPLRLWRGVSAMFAGCIPAHAAYFSIFESMKAYFNATQNPALYTLCGAVAAVSHDMIMTPFDVIKQRMQLGYYKNMAHCINTIVRTEGIRALYVSLPTTLAMNIPYGAIMVPVNEVMKTALNPSGRYSTKVSMLSGAVAGAVAAALTTPLDVIKTKLQTQSLEPVTPDRPCKYSLAGEVRIEHGPRVPGARSLMTSATAVPRPPDGLRATIRKIVKEEGFRVFTKGMLPRIMTNAPAVAISWTAYETVKDLLQT